MPVWKYRSVEEMPEAWEMKRGQPLGPRIRAVLSLAPIAGPLRIPRGVRKFRTIEEMVAEREHYEQERVDRLRAERLRK